MPPLPAGQGASAPALTRGLVTMFAFCCGAIVANIYYAQPILELIAPDLGMSAGMASLIVALTQIGYALGLFFIVPLGDLLENRKLMIATALLSILSLGAAALSRQPHWFLAVSLLVGFSSVVVQLIIPLAAHLAAPAERGRVVGTIMGGLLLGVLLSRPAASFIADHFGWRAVFGAAAVAMALVTVLLARTMPTRQPSHQASYGALLASLAHLARTVPPLRHRSLYQGLMFGCFSLFWTAAPIELTRHYGLSQSAIGLFSLIGAMGATSAPLSGRLADAGHTVRATLIALALGALAFVPGLVAWRHGGLVALAACGIVLDFAVQMNMVQGQREIYGLAAESRNRLNALYMTSIFIGGSVGSALASALYEHGGWRLVAAVGMAFPAIALLHYLLVGRPHAMRRAASRRL